MDTLKTDPLDEIRASLQRIEQALQDQARGQKQIRWFIDMEAGLSTARFILEHMPDLQPHPHRKALLKFAVDQVSLDGLFVEFGVYSGKTINIIAARYDGPVHGFDSFEGLPEPGGVSLA